MALTTSNDHEEFAGAAGDRAVYERKAGNALSGGLRDLFSVVPDGSAPAVPLGQTANDEYFSYSF